VLQSSYFKNFKAAFESNKPAQEERKGATVTLDYLVCWLPVLFDLFGYLFILLVYEWAEQVSGCSTPASAAA